MEQPAIPYIEQTESIKLVKNTKGYNWEIKILGTSIARLEELDKQMYEKWGNKE